MDSDLPVGSSTAPELSVIIAAYNAADTLEEQLTALTAAPTDFPFEILVCDNGSTDRTVELVSVYAQTAPVRLVDASARRGPAAARNIGVDAARSPLVAFCDADDVVEVGWPAVMRAVLDRYEFVAGSFDFEVLNEGRDFGGLWTAQSTGLTRKAYLPEFFVAGAGNLGIRKSVFEEVGGFYEPLRTAEDDDLCLRVQLRGHELAFVPELVLHVRRRGGLVDLCRQAYAYAAGEKRLAYRYSAYVRGDSAADLSAAIRAADPAASNPPPQAAVSRMVAVLARAGRKALRVRRPADLAAVAWRWSWALGWRSTAEDPRIPRIDPADPTTLVASRIR